jgi:haloalkane dehalogenase
MTEYFRTPDASFADLTQYQFSPNYHQWHDLRMHYLDEGPKDGPVMLLMHGMPAWSYLYRDIIPLLVAAGYRCIAPDHLGFGKSDKPSDIHWYSIARHSEVLMSLIVSLDLQRITLLCQDWGGPIGLAQAATMPERFERLSIMNTWLHHPEFKYSAAIERWRNNWQEGGLFAGEKPNVGVLIALSAKLISRELAMKGLISGSLSEYPSPACETMVAAYNAPFSGLDDDSYNGLRRFPLSIPMSPSGFCLGNGPVQALHYNLLLQWQKPVHFIWGCQDDVFDEQWGRQWASKYSQATFDPIEDAGHFLQNTHGEQIANTLLARIAQEG